MEPPYGQNAVEPTRHDSPALDDVTAYEDGNAHVICDSQNPSAWIRSDFTVTIDP
jgi:hypothetical protein